ncbi:MAG: tRNA (guanine(10)-N(2))-dimethyltransferase [archaeon]
MKTKEINEGKTRLIVPDIKGIPEEGEIFYNPAMAANRSISLLVLNSLYDKKDKARVADALCGVGARAVRYANEGNDFEVFANDIQPSASALCAKNAELNGVNVTSSVSEANQFLMAHKYERFDFIDIDPFGSPAHFINSALHALKQSGGVLGITATDTGTLAGIYPKACFRRYGIISDRTSFVHELGVRNLIAFVFREAAKFECTVRPLFSYNHIHYDRAFVRVISGRKTTNRDVENAGFVKYCPKCERRTMIPVFEDMDARCECGERALLLGPTWVERIADVDFLDKMLEKKQEINYDKKALRFVQGSDSEYSVSVPYYSIAALTRVFKKESNSTNVILGRLRDKGYKAYSTHFFGQGIKTNAPYDEVIGAVLRK